MEHINSIDVEDHKIVFHGDFSGSNSDWCKCKYVILKFCEEYFCKQMKISEYWYKVVPCVSGTMHVERYENSDIRIFSMNYLDIFEVEMKHNCNTLDLDFLRDTFTCDRPTITKSYYYYKMKYWHDGLLHVVKSPNPIKISEYPIIKLSKKTKGSSEPVQFSETTREYDIKPDDKAYIDYYCGYLRIDFTVEGNDASVKLNPFTKNNMPEFIKAIVYYYLFKAAVEENDISEYVDIEKEVRRYRLFTKFISKI